MDKIYVNKMEFYGYHGVFPEETKLGQRFKVDLIVQTDLAKAGKRTTLKTQSTMASYMKYVKMLLRRTF